MKFGATTVTNHVDVQIHTKQFLKHSQPCVQNITYINNLLATLNIFKGNDDGTKIAALASC